MIAAPFTLVAGQISKRFGPTRALDGVSISLLGGEVHSIVGENGAGKSTLMKILSGVERPSAGTLALNGRPVVFDSVVQAERAGVVMIHQELNLIDELSVAENISLGRERTCYGLIDRRGATSSARDFLQRLDMPINPARRVGDLSLAQRQMVEIAKALARNARLLIMDEPTAVLTNHETVALFKVIDQLRSSGVAVVYISHLLPDVLRLSDRITVLRDGALAASLDAGAVKTTTEQQLARLMVGRPLGQHYPPRATRDRDVVLRVQDLLLHGYSQSATFHVCAGEILGFAGLIGAGRTETAEAIAGLRKFSDGTITLGGEAIEPRTSREAVELGIAYLSEDRKGSGLILDMPVVQNMTLVSLRRFARGLINKRAERKAARSYADRLHIKAKNLNAVVSTLSGGNQQKVLLAKWLDTSPRLLIVDEPTRGVDIGAREEIYRILRELTEAGVACIMISSDLNEVLGMSDRIAVMRGGQIVATLEGATATEDVVMQYAAGVNV